MVYLYLTVNGEYGRGNGYGGSLRRCPTGVFEKGMPRGAGREGTGHGVPGVRCPRRVFVGGDATGGWERIGCAGVRAGVYGDD